MCIDGKRLRFELPQVEPSTWPEVSGAQIHLNYKPLDLQWSTLEHEIALKHEPQYQYFSNAGFDQQDESIRL